MKMTILPRRQLATIALLACAAAWSPLASAQATATPIVVIDSTGFGFYSAYNVGTTEWRGPTFTTGTVPTQITEITLGLSNADPTTTATLSLFQLDDSSELPTGAALATATLPIVTGNDGANLFPNTYTSAQLGGIPSITLLAGKKYALILSSPSGGYVGLSDNDGPANAYTFAGGFSAAGTGYVQTVDSGAVWVQNNFTTPAIKLSVVPVQDPPVIVDPVLPPATPTPVPGLGTLGLVSLASALGLLGLRRNRNRNQNRV